MLAIEPEDGRTSRGRADEPQQKADRRRLAGAIGAEVSHDLTWLDNKVEVLEGDGMPVVLGQPFGLDRRSDHHAPLTRFVVIVPAPTFACRWSRGQWPKRVLSITDQRARPVVRERAGTGWPHPTARHHNDTLGPRASTF